MDIIEQNQSSETSAGAVGEFTRRELGRRLAAGAAIGLGGGLLFPAPAHAALTAEEKASLSKVLIERLLNTRYRLDSQGVLTVYPQDEVWSSGGAMHQAWLLDTVVGLKVDTRAALEETIYDPDEHAGILTGMDLTIVQDMLQRGADSGIFDDLNTIYWVLKEKIRVETEGACDKGVEYFDQWIQAHTSVDAATKESVHDLVLEYLSQPATNDDGEWY